MSNSNERGIVIVGAGHGGVQLAASLRDAGYEGSVTLLSAEGDIPYHRPPLSKSFMKTPDAELQGLRGANYFGDQQIDLQLNTRVVEINRSDQQLILAGGQAQPYDHLVLAPGMLARELQVDGSVPGNVFYLRTAEDARQMRDGLPVSGNVVVIGGGFIGLEAAAMLADRGLDVTVVEIAGRLLGRAVSPTIAEAVEQYLENLGVQVLCDTSVLSLSGNELVSSVELGNGSSLPASMVVVGIGAIPDSELAERAGLSIENGIAVDEYLHTSDPAISAIGDCAFFPHARSGRNVRLESVQNATDQARALAKTLTGEPTPYRALPWFWSDIGAQKLQIAGLALDTDEELVVRNTDSGSVQSVWRYNKGGLIAVETLNSAGEHMLARRIIGENIVLDRSIVQSGDVAQLKAAYKQAISG